MDVSRKWNSIMQNVENKMRKAKCVVDAYNEAFL